MLIKGVNKPNSDLVNEFCGFKGKLTDLVDYEDKIVRNVIGQVYVREWFMLRYVWLTESYDSANSPSERWGISLAAHDEHIKKDMSLLIEAVREQATIPGTCGLILPKHLERELEDDEDEDDAERQLHPVPVNSDAQMVYMEGQMHETMFIVNKDATLDFVNFDARDKTASVVAKIIPTRITVFLDTFGLENQDYMHVTYPRIPLDQKFMRTYEKREESGTHKQFFHEHQEVIVLIKKMIEAHVIPDVCMVGANLIMKQLRCILVQKYRFNAISDQAFVHAQYMIRSVAIVEIATYMKAHGYFVQNGKDMDEQTLRSWIDALTPMMYASKAATIFALSLWLPDAIMPHYAKLFEYVLSNSMGIKLAYMSLEERKSNRHLEWMEVPDAFGNIVNDYNYVRAQGLECTIGELLQNSIEFHHLADKFSRATCAQQVRTLWYDPESTDSQPLHEYKDVDTSVVYFDEDEAMNPIPEVYIACGAVIPYIPCDTIIRTLIDSCVYAGSEPNATYVYYNTRAGICPLLKRPDANKTGFRLLGDEEDALTVDLDEYVRSVCARIVPT